ncbi:SoxR reducing system RseC family protein [Pseudomonas sp. UL073]|uniref:SoxR reducing system RseC family protein n=1 Tax=Zestomonas insulae TaxID=2809017 RepID=A0ABS2IBB5_9GAMM|nr:SoxR reducing system RseC family protein [Pseudomonas insulae]MBM7060409.1 SoxR reducing system RseC family protein [Pseudomonas insulae]
MIEESGRVVGVESGAVWVETLRKSTCSACAANAGCGQGMLDKLGVGRDRGHVRALSDLRLAVGDAVVIGVDEQLLVRASLLVYLLPLLALIGAAVLAKCLALTEPLIILFGLGGLVLAAFVVRWHSHRLANNPASQPIVLRALLTGSAGLP